MEFKRLTKVKPIVGLLIILTLVCMLFTLTACQDKQIDAQEIEIVSDSVPEIAISGKVELSKIKVSITDKEGKVQEIALTSSMLDAASKALLLEKGEKTINVFYKDCATTFTIFLVDEGTETVCVTFLGKDGSQLGKHFAVKGGSVSVPTPPTEAGLVFDAWLNQTTSDIATFNEVAEDMIVYASYVENANKYTVTFVDYKNNVVKELTNISYGSKITPPTWVTPFELSNSVWNWDFINQTVTQNATITMNVVYKERPIEIKYVTSEDAVGANQYHMDTTAIVRYKQVPSDAILNSAISELSAKDIVFTKWINLESVQAGTSSTLLALVQAKVYTITFEDNSYSKVNLTTGQSYTFPNTTPKTKTGYEFAMKWQNVNDSEQLFTASQAYVIDRNLTIKACYAPVSVAGEFTFVFNQLKDEGNPLTYKVEKADMKYDEIVNVDYVTTMLNTLKSSYNNINNFDIDIINRVTQLVPKETEAVNSSGLKLNELNNYFFEIDCMDNSLGSVGLDYEKVVNGENSYCKVIGYNPDNPNIELNVVIPNQYILNEETLPVIEIDDNVFTGHNYAMRLTLGENITTIGSNAFDGVKFLSNIDLKNVTTIGNNAFANASVASYDNEENETIYNYIKVLGGNMIEISDNMFANSTGIIEVNLPSTVVSIGTNAFINCTDLAKINLNNVTTIKGMAFSGNSKLSDIGNLNKVITLGSLVFANTLITNIELPVIKTIAGDSLKNMPSVINISLASASVLDDSTLEFNLTNIVGNIALTSLILGNQVTTFANDTTVGDLNDSIINTIDFGDLEKIEPITFNMLNRLATVIVSDVPHDIDIGSGVIMKTNYEVRNGVLLMFAIDENNADNNINGIYYYPSATFGDYTIPADIDAVYDAGIINAHFNKLTITRSVYFESTGIADVNIVSLPYEVALAYTFNDKDTPDVSDDTYDFDNIDLMFNATCQYYISDYETCLDVNATDYATKLAARNSWKDTLDGINNTKIVVAESSLTYRYDEASKLLYTVDAENRATVISGDETATSITIPTTLSGNEVIAIADNAFANYTYLQTLDIQATLVNWNMSGAFNNCTSLANITLAGLVNKDTINFDLLNTTKIYNDNIVVVLAGLPVAYNADFTVNSKNIVNITAEDLEGVTYIPFGIFNNANKLETIVLPDTVSEIADNAFENAIKLKSFDTNQVSTLGSQVFKGCTELVSVLIPNAINGASANNGKLPEGTFENCTSLTSVEMPNVNGFSCDAEFNSSAFKNCTALKDISFLNHFTGTIYKETFQNCSAITEVDFSNNSIEEILDNAFDGCNALVNVEFSVTIRVLGNNAFANCNNLKTIRIKGYAGIFTEPEEGEEENVIAVGVFPDDAYIYVDLNSKVRADIVFANYDYSTYVKTSEPRITFAMKTNYEAGLNGLGKPQVSKSYFTTEPTAPEFEGYLFVGWYIGNNHITFPFNTTSNVTLEAKYYDVNVGSINSSDLVAVLDSNNNTIGYKIDTYLDTDSYCYIPSIFVDGDIEKNIISINLSAFASKTITELVIPEGITELYGSLTTSNVIKITIPSSVKNISSDAFTDMTNLEIIWAENSQLVNASLSSFSNTKWYTTAENAAKNDTNYGFVIAGRLAIAFVGINNKLNIEAILPSNVIKLNDNLFKDNKTLKTVILNDALQFIGAGCFSGATAIENILYETEAANSNLVDVDIDTIGIIDTIWYANQNKVILGTILIKYKDSYGAETVNIPSYITKIGKNAMMNTQAKQIVFEGNNVIEIGDYAFKNTKLTSFILPNSVLKLGVGVFANCVDLLIFDGSNSNASITKLPNEFFANSDVNVSNGLLSNLETVTLGNNFKELGIDNFKNCGKLKNITANGICISTDIYLSEIKSTPWANPTVTVGDQHIIIGSVYLKYLQGTEPNRGADNLIIVEVPKGITIIYQKAFFNNNQIGQVVLPKTLVDIKGEAFKDCVKLYKVSITGIAIPAEIPVVETCVLSTIDVSAFENTALNEIIFPQTLITIGDKAFKSTKLVNVTIPNSVTSIGMEAFASIDELEVLTIGKGITIIGNRAFADNDSLSKVNWTLEKATVKISNEDKITIKQFDNIDKSLADVTNYTNDKGIYINNLFVRDGGIKVRIYVSNDAYSIIEVSDLVYINNWTGAISSFGFYKEGEMPQISFDGEGYIMDAYNKEVINNAAELGVPTRADHTFMGWYEDETYINPLIYPYKINSDITIYAKWYTNNWDTDHNPADELVYSVNNNQYTIIGWDAVASTTLFIPNKVNNIAVKEIAIDAANKAKASTVTKIIFTQASNFTDLDTNIFIDFVNLEEVVLCDSNTNNVAYKVVNGALYSTDNTVLIAYFKQYNIDAENIKTLVTTFSIPKNTQFIMPYAFYNSGLTTISIPSTVTDIGKNAFSNNTTTITFDKDIKLVNVDKSSFNNTIWYTQSAYKYYTVNSSNLGTFYAAANVLLEYHEVAAPSLLTLPSSMNEFVITVLASNMYTRLNDNYSRDAYSNVILPDKLERINSEAFALKDAPSDGQIHWLDSESFDGSKCSATLTYIANDVFSKTKYYTEYHNVDLLILGKVLLRYLNTASTLNLVNEKIQTIAKGAFKASKIVSIILPSTLLVIGDEAFSSCDKLTSIEIPSNVTKIGERAFLNCQALVTITYAGEKLVSMGSQIFSGCYHIKNMMIPYSVTEIGVGAFESCTDLERIYFDKPVYALNTETNEMVLSGWSTKSKLATLGAQAFEKCSSLTDIAIPNGLAKISESTFKDCSDLINVVFETDKSMVKLIEIEAFYNCGKLGSIIDVSNPTLITLELPNRLTTVQDNAFYGCTGLYGVLFNYNIASIGNNVFGACRNLAKIEISAANAPSITNNTFLRKYTVDVTPIDPYYALRIYVGDDTDIYSDYTSDWAAANSGDNAFTLCKKSDPKPSLIYSYRKETGGETLTGSFEVPVNMRKDVYINPTYTFYSTSVKEWKFVNVAGGVDDSRIGKTLGNATTLPYTRQYNPNTAIYDYILIMDHDIKLGNVEE